VLLYQEADLSGGDVGHPFEDADRPGCIRPILPGASRPIWERQLSAGELFQPALAFGAAGYVGLHGRLFPSCELVGQETM
jgi:hypothetical protein